MSNIISIFTFLFLLAAPGLNDAAQAQQPGETEIFRIELVTRLDATIDGGGFETTGPIDRRLVKDVQNCIAAVHQAAVGWAKRERLVIALEERRESSLILHFERPQQKGIYEVAYRVSVSRGYATGGFKFYDSTGTQSSGPTGRYQEFIVQLRKAILCR